MRDYTRKAKRIDDGELIVGHTVRYGFTGQEKWYIVPHYASALYAIEIDPTTICDPTGFTDKNGNLIWENDVVRGHDNPNDLAKVVFGEVHVIDAVSLANVDSVVGWHTEVIPTDSLSKCEPFCLPMPLTDFYIKQSEWETIGSIFDNSELLKREGQMIG